MIMSRLALAILVLLTYGCDGLLYDLDGVPFEFTEIPPDMDHRDAGDADVPMVPDADVEDTEIPDGDPPPDPDMESDAGDMTPDMGSTCEVPQPLDPDRCNPTESGVCPGDGFCSLAISGAPPPELFCVMRDKEGTGDDGAACASPADCLEGLTCVIWNLNSPDPRGQECAKFCELETNAGCGPEEFCTTAPSQPDLAGIGWCTPRCDPYDDTACPAGQTCTIDFNYPTSTCEPNFRCVTVTDVQGEGDECGPDAGVSRCIAGLSCYETNIADFRCVSPCQGDDECPNGVCGDPAGPWNLRYCVSG